jgi:hypothetical protein
VFPVRYELNVYLLCTGNLVFKGLKASGIYGKVFVLSIIGLSRSNNLPENMVMLMKLKENVHNGVFIQPICLRV